MIFKVSCFTVILVVVLRCEKRVFTIVFNFQLSMLAVALAQDSGLMGLFPTTTTGATTSPCPIYTTTPCPPPYCPCEECPMRTCPDCNLISTTPVTPTTEGGHCGSSLEKLIDALKVLEESDKELKVKIKMKSKNKRKLSYTVNAEKKQEKDCEKEKKDC